MGDCESTLTLRLTASDNNRGFRNTYPGLFELGTLSGVFYDLSMQRNRPKVKAVYPCAGSGLYGIKTGEVRITMPVQRWPNLQSSLTSTRSPGAVTEEQKAMNQEHKKYTIADTTPVTGTRDCIEGRLLFRCRTARYKPHTGPERIILGQTQSTNQLVTFSPIRW